MLRDTVHRRIKQPRAIEDIKNALNWLSEQAPHKTVEWIHALESEIQSLEALPQCCPLAPENRRWESELELRQLLFDRYPSIYRIIFTILGDTVRVLQIRHGARRFIFESDEESQSCSPKICLISWFILMTCLT
jgi:plasmid stabilization system protein ParE